MIQKTITPEQSRDARSELGLSQNTVSIQSGIGRAYLSQFENGIRRLNDSELLKLRSLYEDEGFIFKENSTTDSALEELEKSQEQLGSKAVDGGKIEVDAFEMSQLLSVLEMLLDGGVAELPFDLESEEASVFNKTNDLFVQYFALDEKGELEASKFFEDRHNKVISLMALQYLRYMMLSGKGLIKTDLVDGESISDGKEAKLIADTIHDSVSETTSIDKYLQELAA